MICMLKVINYCLRMYLKILEINALKYMNLIQFIFHLHQGYHDKPIFFKKRTKIRIID